MGKTVFFFMMVAIAFCVSAEAFSAEPVQAAATLPKTAAVAKPEMVMASGMTLEQYSAYLQKKHKLTPADVSAQNSDSAAR